MKTIKIERIIIRDLLPGCSFEWTRDTGHSYGAKYDCTYVGKTGSRLILCNSFIQHHFLYFSNTQWTPDPRYYQKTCFRLRN